MLAFGGFEWVEETCELNEDLRKSYNHVTDEGYLLEAYVYKLMGKLHMANLNDRE